LEYTEIPNLFLTPYWDNVSRETSGIANAVMVTKAKMVSKDIDAAM
jgi:hypothetical protein